MVEGQAKYLPYPAYKPSGVDWLGDIPEGWEVSPIRGCANIVNGYPFDSKLFNENTGTPLIRIRDLNAIEAKTRYSGQIVPMAVVTNDDVLIGMDGDFNVGRWRGKELALLNQRMCCVRGSSQELTRYLEYALPVPLKLINDITYSTTVKHLSSYQVEKIRICLPKVRQEINLILTFLDHETAKIDALIAKQQRLIALLEEKRQAVISHAVTKGLDPTAPLRPSGIDWLGDIPAHWDVKPLKHCSNIRYGIGEPPEYHDKGTPLIRATNIRSGKISSVGLVLVDPKDIPSNRIVWLKAGDIVVVRSGATTGDSSIISSEYANSIAGFDMVVSPIRCMPEYLGFALLSNYLKTNQIEIETTRAAQPHLNAEELGNCFVILPSISEQEKIVTFISSKLTKFDALVLKAKQTVTLLKERRTALISAAVTGKIDLRDWQPLEGTSDISTQGFDQPEEALT